MSNEAQDAIRREVAEVIAEEAAALARRAKDVGLPILSDLLECARAEAKQRASPPAAPTDDLLNKAEIVPPETRDLLDEHRELTRTRQLLLEQQIALLKDLAKASRRESQSRAKRF
jgi:hypothetical protein